jgi:hypothetical protein
MGWAEHVTQMGELRHAYEMLVGRLQTKSSRRGIILK